MRTRLWLATMLVAPIAIFSSHSAPAAAKVQTVGRDASSLEDQVDLGITVYNPDIALVRDARELPLPHGSFDLKFMDIAATVNPATVHFRSLTEPSRVNVLEQNYEYDLLEPDKLLRKYVGRDVTLVRTREADGTTHEEDVKARLLSFNTAPVWQIDHEIVTGLNADHIRFPELPVNLYTHPTLIWTINNSETKQVSMLTGSGIPVRKRYVVDGQAFYYRNAQHPGSPIKDSVQVYYQFKNEERAGLGVPMPSGVVRVYQADAKGGTQFVGEDRVDHTPK